MCTECVPNRNPGSHAIAELLDRVTCAACGDVDCGIDTVCCCAGNASGRRRVLAAPSVPDRAVERAESRSYGPRGREQPQNRDL